MYKCNGQNPTTSLVGTNQGNGFGVTNPNGGSGYYPAANFLRQFLSYFFSRNPRQRNEHQSNRQNDGYGFTGRDNAYGFYEQNDRYSFNRPSGGYGFQK